MSRFLTISEIVEFALLGNDDFLQRDKMKLHKWAKLVYADMNLETIQTPTRKSFTINRRTNSIDLPCEAMKLSSVSVRDVCGAMHPVWRNESINDDIVEVSAAKNCACEHECGGRLCNTIKGYEAVVEIRSDELPNGDPISFECVDRKVINKGVFYQELQFPKRVYEDGVWVNTIKETELTRLCAVQVDANDCVCDTDANEAALCAACGGTSLVPPAEGVTEWTYYCNSRMDYLVTQCGSYCYKPFKNIYNISELGDRLIFPADFPFDKVIVRYYENVALKDMVVPRIAAEAFITGLKFYNVEWNDKKQMLANVYGQKYTNKKWGLGIELNKCRLEEQKMMMQPPITLP